VNRRHFILLGWTWGVAGSLPIMAEATGKPGVFEINGIAAKVSGRVITKNQIHMLMVSKKRKLDAKFPQQGAKYEEELEEIRIQTIQEQIERLKLIDRFNKPPIQIDGKAVENEIGREIRDVYEGDRELFRETLRSFHMTMDGYRSLIREKLLAEALGVREAGRKGP